MHEEVGAKEIDDCTQEGDEHQNRYLLIVFLYSLQRVRMLFT